MVRKDGKIGGYGTPGFILLMLIVAGNMVGKDFWMEIVLNSTKSTAAWIWALTCLLPQVLLVKSQINCSFKKEIRKQFYLFQTISIWLINFGAKTTCQFLKLYPSYFLLGIFSPFMVSGEVQNDGKIKTMTISTKWTLINFTLSIIGSVSGYLAYEIGVQGKSDIWCLFVDCNKPFGSVSFFLPTFVPAAICLAVLLFSEKLCSSCCKVNLPILYKTGVDINDFSKIIDLPTEQDYGTNEEESKEMDGAHQFESSVVEISHINAD